MQHPLKIGITGGIGSGKTTISKIFESFGVPVYRSDEESKHLLDTDKELKAAIKEVFGNAVYDAAGLLNRKILASAVFGNNEKLTLLNHITHPAVRRHFLNWVKQQSAPYIMKEAAIMYESGANQDIDLMITVYAPKELRMQRALSRENTTQEQVEARMQTQLPEEKKMEMADFTIFNDDTQAVLPQALRLHELFLQKARQ